MPSYTCLRLSDVSIICSVTYFQFPIQSTFLPYIGRQAASALWRIGFDTQYRTWDVSDNLGRYFSCTERTSQGTDFELIPTVKMETGHPVEGHFGSKFPAICNYCGVMAAWSRKTWKFCEQILRFMVKRPLMVQFLKLCSESLHGVYYMGSTPIDIVVFKWRKICPTENRWNSALFTWQKNIISAASLTVATARIAPKICQGQPPTMSSQCSRFHRNRWSNSRTREHCFLPRRVFPLFARSMVSRRILAASSGKVRFNGLASVRLSHLFSNLNRKRGAYLTWLTRRQHATRPAYIFDRVYKDEHIIV